MKKTIKIRFVEIYDDNLSIKYTVQKKVWYGWKDICYIINQNEYMLAYKYYDKNPQKLLETVLVEHFKTCKKFVTIIEYPSLKIY